ncbi:MAG: hypothetical protein C4558_06300 [Dehalococcoidia bacterium]|nr:MAG: hypothetical protein C4558_06300 [Dehalococcoidia bacterium]
MTPGGRYQREATAFCAGWAAMLHVMEAPSEVGIVLRALAWTPSCSLDAALVRAGIRAAREEGSR